MEFLKPAHEVLGTIKSESQEKVSSSLSGPAEARAKFIELSRHLLSTSELDQVLQALSFAETLPSRDPHHPSMQAYFAHPLRVATFVLRLCKEPSVQTTSMALLHNIFEVSGLDESDLVAAGFADRIGSGIKLLTVDRNRQYDPEYLEGFHDRIKEFGEDLALIRCVDRMDNLLAFDLIERTPTISTYLELSERFVVPLAYSLDQEFGDYLEKLTKHVRQSDCDPELKQQYEKFLKQNAH